MSTSVTRGHAGRSWAGTLFPIVLAASAAAAAAVIARGIPTPIAMAAVLGAAAVVAIRANPLLTVAVITAVRATLEGLQAHTVTRAFGVQLSPPDVVTLAFVVGSVWWMSTRIRKGTFDWHAPTLVPAMLFFGIASVSMTYSPDWSLGARDLLKFFGAYCAYLVIINERPEPHTLRLLLGLAVGGAVLPIIIGWYQFFNDIGKPGLFHGGLRIQSTFDHPNTYGFYLVSVLAACWGLSRTLTGIPRKAVEAVAIICFMAIFTTLSRNTWAATAVLVLVVGRKYRRVLVSAAVVVSAVALAMPRVIGAFLGLFNPRQGTNGGNSALGRLDLWTRDLSVWRESPVLGKGFGSTMGNTGALAHNDYLRALVEAGIFGLASFLLLMGSLVRASWRAALGRGDLPLAFFGLSVGYVIVSAASNNMGKGAFQFYFWLLAGISYVWAQVVPAGEPRGDQAARAEALASGP
jgi:putative inorganic carbon (hco3(-)) transporter